MTDSEELGTVDARVRQPFILGTEEELVLIREVQPYLHDSVRSRGRTASMLVIVLVMAIVTLGVLIRLSAATDRDLHGDEAHYAAAAWHVSEKGNFLFHGVWNEKPPVFHYLTAVAYTLFGFSQASSYIVNQIASGLAIIVVFVVGAKVRNATVGLTAALVLAVSPLAAAYGPTSFLDAVAALFGILGVYLAVSNLPTAAGLTLALSFATKQNSLFFFPLVLALVMIAAWFARAPDRGARRLDQAFGLWAMGCLVVIGPLLVWSLHVQIPRLASFGLSFRPEAVDLDFAQSWPGFWLWVGLLSLAVLDSPFIVHGYVWLLPVAIVWLSILIVRQSPDRCRFAFELILHGWTLCYLLVLGAGQLPLWNRYLVIAIPVVSVSFALLVESMGSGLASLLGLADSRRKLWDLARRIVPPAVICLVALVPVIDMDAFIASKLDAGKGGYYYPKCVTLLEPAMVERAKDFGGGNQVVLLNTVSHLQWVFEFYLLESVVTPIYVEPLSMSVPVVQASSGFYLVFCSPEEITGLAEHLGCESVTLLADTACGATYEIARCADQGTNH